MDFFNSCKDKEEAKKTYRQLCKHFHPDKGGDAELMKDLQMQYEKFHPANNFTAHIQSAYGNGRAFVYSTPRGNFDNPLHEEIRCLKIANTNLQNQLRIVESALKSKIDVLIVKERYYEDIIKNLRKENDDLFQEYNEEADKVEKLTSINFKEMSVFQFLKYKWNKENEK